MRKIILAALALAIVGCYAKPDKPYEPPATSGTADMDLSRPGIGDGGPYSPTITQSTPATAAPAPAAATAAPAEPAAAAGGGY